MPTDGMGNTGKQKIIKIGLVYDHLLDIGGVETHLLTLFQSAQQRGFHFVIFAPVAERFRNLVAPFGVEVVPWENWNIFDLTNLFKLRSQFIYYGLDLVHVHSPTAGVVGRLAAWLAGIPRIVTVHLPVYLYHGRKTSLRANTGRMLYTWIDRALNFWLTGEMIYVSKATMEQCLKMNLAPARICSYIPNGVDINLADKLPKRAILREQFGAKPNDCILIFAGRLDDQKGVDLLPAIFLPLQEEYPNLKLWVVGDGPLRYTIESQMQKVGPTKQIVFWGYRQDIASMLKASDILIMPSRYEALPFVLLEALAAGLPCIVTETGDNKILVESGINGFMIAVDEIEDFQSSVRILASDKSLRDQQGEASRKKAMDFDEKKSVQQVYEKYIKLTEGHKLI